MRGSKAKRLRREAAAKHPEGSMLGLIVTKKGVFTPDSTAWVHTGFRKTYQDSKKET
jgi:hypothetical protein